MDATQFFLHNLYSVNQVIGEVDLAKNEFQLVVVFDQTW